MVLDQRRAERPGLVKQSRMEVASSNCCPRLGESRVEQAKIANTRRSAGGLDQPLMKLNDLAEREVSHYTRRR